MTKAKKQRFIQQLLDLNSNLKQVGASDVWMGESVLENDGKHGLKMINMTIKLPYDAHLEHPYIVSAEGIRILLWRP